ncbi:hypothetical protein FRB98_009674 [Tulasnella sp. 332]|nr:hypothetical protein FRB98_009674 [Tulasnella sp. 332]
MPFRSNTFTATLPCIEFLDAYPYPSFVLSQKQSGKLAASLTPVWVNAAYRELIFGPHVDEPHVFGGLLEALPGTGFQELNTARKLSIWVELLGDEANVPYLLDLEPPWLGAASPTIQLELTKTSIQHFWIITSVPKTPLPRPQSIPHPSSTSSSLRHRPGSEFLSLGELPAPHWEQLDKGSKSPGTPTETTRADSGGIFTAGKRSVKMLKEYPWETTPLGPMKTWSSTLLTAVDVCMNHPHPVALWWGPEVTLIYNDAYAHIAGKKHPQLFGQSGKIAWGELWEELGPLYDQVMTSGNSVACNDDRLFFDALTEAKLPMETYHSWAWLPIRGEDRTVAGILNTTQESTSKVLYERRIKVLRGLGVRTTSARSKAEFTQIIHEVLTKETQFDIPFVAFYFNTVEAPARPRFQDRSLEADEKLEPSTIQVTSKLMFKIGVPDEHPAIPSKQVHVLDRASLKPVRGTQPRPASPGSTVLGRTLTEESHTVVSSDSEDIESENLSAMEPQWPFFDIFSVRRPVYVQNLPPSIAADPRFGHRDGGFNDTPREAVIIPVATDDDEVPAAVMIIGLNTRRPYDTEQRTWISLLRVSLSYTLTAALGREAEVKKAEQLAQLDAAKTNFFSSASHELRTPLTLIAGPVRDAFDVTKEPKVKDLLSLAMRNTSRLGRLVDSLMDFSRLEAGRLIGRFKLTELASFTIDLASLFRKPIERESLEYSVACDRTDETAVYVDQELWEKIVFNIIGNAFKYTMKGHVHVYFKYRPPYAEFIVSDTGVGIPADDLDKIFERFHRVAASVQLTILDNSDPESPHGTTFTVYIPLGTEHLSRENIDETDDEFKRKNTYGIGIIEEASGWAKNAYDDVTPSESVSSDTAGESNTESSKSGEMTSLFRFAPDDVILVVDDNRDVRKFIQFIFKRFCSVIEAENSMEALMLMQAQRPNLVITDFMMPGMDGMQFVNAIKEKPSLELVPVIILTARAGDEARIEGLMSGADDYMSKPFKSRELIARAHLHMQIGKRKMQMQKAFELSKITGFVHPDSRKSLLNLTTAALESEGGGCLELQWINGRWTKLQVERVENGLIGTVTDVSDRRLYEAAQLAQAKEREVLAQLRAADAEKQRADADERRRGQELLVDVTSHELRQPVSAILNCSQLVRVNMENLIEKLRSSENQPFVPTPELLATMEEDLDALDSIYQCGLSQERIANDVLSLSRMQLETLSVQSIEFPLVKELRRILSIFTNELRMKKITLDLKLGDSISLLGVDKVASDRNRFGQIITNLMSNAIKFTDISLPPNRQIIVFLDLSVEPPLANSCVVPPKKEHAMIPKKLLPDQEVFVYVAVQDSGPGLKPGDLALLFQRFQQGSNSHEVFGGSGLGLFVSRKLCELMGGNIEVSSVYGQGATFRFFIKVHTTSPSSNSSKGSGGVPQTPISPISLISLLPLPALSPHVIVPPAPHASSSRPTTQTSYHILITEDNLINQTVLNRQLKHAGFTTELASNGKEALEAVKRLASGEGTVDPALPRQFDVILMDCEMPVMDGHTAAREIRRLEGEGVLPLRNWILALTGNARQGQVDAALKSGMDDIIIKPYKIDELITKIRDRIHSNN